MKRAAATKGVQALSVAKKLVEEYWEQLLEDQRTAFSDMVSRGRPLSEKQAEWVLSVAERHGVMPSRNLFSSLSVADQEAERARVSTTLPWERGEVARPLKPPGRT